MAHPNPDSEHTMTSLIFQLRNQSFLMDLLDIVLSLVTPLQSLVQLVS